MIHNDASNNKIYLYTNYIVMLIKFLVLYLFNVRNLQTYVIKHYYLSLESVFITSFNSLQSSIVLQTFVYCIFESVKSCH